MFYIKTASKNDLNAILEIEKISYPRPWDLKAFECELSKHSAGSSLFYAAKRESDDRVLGYVVGNIVVDYIHVLNIAVDEEFRRKGIAEAFLSKLEREALKMDVRSMTLEVRENNEPAVKLYGKMGYEVRAKREKFYEDKYDGLIMWKKL